MEVEHHRCRLEADALVRTSGADTVALDEKRERPAVSCFAGKAKAKPTTDARLSLLARTGSAALPGTRLRLCRRQRTRRSQVPQRSRANLASYLIDIAQYSYGLMSQIERPDPKDFVRVNNRILAAPDLGAGCVDQEPVSEIRSLSIGQELIEVWVLYRRCGRCLLVLHIANEDASLAVPPRQVGFQVDPPTVSE